MAEIEPIECLAKILTALGALAAAASGIKYGADSLEEELPERFFRSALWWHAPAILFITWVSLALLDPATVTRPDFFGKASLALILSLFLVTWVTGRDRTGPTTPVPLNKAIVWLLFVDGFLLLFSGALVDLIHYTHFDAYLATALHLP